MPTVSEEPATDFAREDAEERVAAALRELTANLIRVTRGAGAAYDIGRQAVVLIEAMKKFRDAAGVWPSSDGLSAMLDIRPEQRFSGEDGRRNALAGAEEVIMRGSLQMAASRLMGQQIQERMGQNEMRKGLSEIEALRQAPRRETKAEALAGTKAFDIALARAMVRHPPRPRTTTKKKS